MQIAVFDHLVGPRSPAGSCDARILAALCDRHDFTVFASELDLPPHVARRVQHVKVPSVRRPALAAFLGYLAGSVIARRWARRRGLDVDLTQATDSALSRADICYAHFCHKAFLSEVWPGVRPPLSPRMVHAWASHRLRAAIEARLARTARAIVVPSEGLRRDLERHYPAARGKITVIRNTVDLDRFRRPPAFDGADVRARMDTERMHTAFVFVALGHFERKGLPVLLEALAHGGPALESARLWVVGGERDLVDAYRRSAKRLGVHARVSFAGRVDDVRPYLWSADAFVAPSHYEAFSLGLLEAAAAGLPLIATRISGSEELVVDGVNGFFVERDASALAAGFERFLALDGADREAMGRAAYADVESLGPQCFNAAWAELYESLRSSETVCPSAGSA